MRIQLLATLVAGTIIFSVAAFGGAQEHDDAHAVKNGVCLLVPSAGSQVKGTISLVQEGDALILVGEVTGLTPGPHGFHIHEFGDLRSADGTAAGGHFNPEGHPHAGLEQEERHAGDLGNIQANDRGLAKVEVRAKGVTLMSVLGRALVVHAGADDLKTQPSGNAGPRAAVGVIGVAAPPKP
jgi:Cu-Zn family superoxide dismutase